MANILVFGNSITYGAWDIEGGWVTRLRRFLDEKVIASQGELDYLVYNLGISGGTTEELVHRLKSEAKSRLEEEGETIIIFGMITINDSYFIYSQNGHKISIDQSKQNVEKLIELAKQITPIVLFVGNTVVDETKTKPISWDADKSYTNEYIRQYDEAVKSICQFKKVPFLELMGNFLSQDYVNMLEDGLHPNTAGHKWMFERVQEFLLKNQVIS